MTTEEIIKALTNGVSEKPYCRRDNDGQMIVFVADDQEMLRIAYIDDYDVVIAQGICEAGERLTEIQEALDASVELQIHYAKLLNMHDGGDRIIFEDTGAWLERLKKQKEILSKKMSE